MHKISLVIPIYNEESNIKKLFDEIINTNVYQLVNNIIFVDDCSKDQSSNLLKKIQESYSKVHILSHSFKCGQSECLKTAAHYTSDKSIVTMDGDGQNNPKDIPKLLDKYFSRKDIYLVGGIRNKRKDSIIKILTSKIANRFRMLILKDDCIDTGCSLKVFDKEIFLSFPFFNGIHRFLPTLFIGFGHKVKYMPVSHRPRLSGFSKYGTLDRLFVGIRDIMKVRKIIINKKKSNV